MALLIYIVMCSKLSGNSKTSIIRCSISTWALLVKYYAYYALHRLAFGERLPVDSARGLNLNFSKLEIHTHCFPVRIAIAVNANKKKKIKTYRTKKVLLWWSYHFTQASSIVNLKNFSFSYRQDSSPSFALVIFSNLLI